MPHGSHARLDARPRRTRRERLWQVGTPVVFLLSGALFVTSAENSDGTDLRPGRYTDMASVVRAERNEATRLTERVAALTESVDGLSARLGDRAVDRYQREVDELSDPAGLTPRTGPGVTVTLTDAPQELIETSAEDPNFLVVHQQDIQAVVNALWRGGAEAVTVQGQRIISTTGIKCTGNTVTLQGVPYSPPYVITGVGDQADLLGSIDDDDYISRYRRDAADPDIAVGFGIELPSEVTAPAYDGLLSLGFATPLEPAAAS
ncbi:DUF881 domain-containing protein [uncultured Nocardioides sp.]|uniref:DUF881 domain-containing protein n=1 Tax=uncultured Nocardioides sp. TaxID=198441 RepID=UPI00260089CC|nr:DUF881 domain-containing protein [uncultured Nocardioides sp.]